MSATSRALCLLCILMAAACGSSGGDDAPDAADAPVVPVEPTDPADLGAFCSGTCNLATCVLEDDDCETGICAWSQALGGAHCSRTCLETCAPGYQCVVPADADEGPAPVRICISNPRVCGNAIVEFGEACDDGNTMPGDLCSPACDAVTQPPSGGTMSWTFHGGASSMASGDEPVVFAHRQTGRLFFGTNRTPVDYAFQLPDSLGPAPLTVTLEASLIENVNGSLCSFAATTTAPIRAIDHATKRIAGQASMVMTCQAGNCDFGCASMVPHTVDFDLRWIETSTAARPAP